MNVSRSDFPDEACGHAQERPELAGKCFSAYHENAFDRPKKGSRSSAAGSDNFP